MPMSTSSAPRPGARTASMTPIGVERMGDAADLLRDPAVLRLENLDTDLLPPREALDATRAAVDDDDANSYLPFFGHDRLRQAATRLVERTGGYASGSIDWRRQCFISAGGLSGVLNALLALIEPGDEVVLTSPTYVGLINRVRLAGGVPRFIRLLPGAGGWRLDAATLARAVTPRTRAFLMMSPSMPSGAVLNRDEWAGGVRGLRGRRCLDDLRQRDGAAVVRRRAALASGEFRRAWPSARSPSARHRRSTA